MSVLVVGVTGRFINRGCSDYHTRVYSMRIIYTEDQSSACYAGPSIYR